MDQTTPVVQTFLQRVDDSACVAAPDRITGHTWAWRHAPRGKLEFLRIDLQVNVGLVTSCHWRGAVAAGMILRHVGTAIAAVAGNGMAAEDGQTAFAADLDAARLVAFQAGVAIATAALAGIGQQPQAAADATGQRCAADAVVGQRSGGHPGNEDAFSGLLALAEDVGKVGRKLDGDGDHADRNLGCGWMGREGRVSTAGGGTPGEAPMLRSCPAILAASG